MYSHSFELSLGEAYKDAREKRHEFITVEHLLLSLLDNPETSTALIACGANLDRLRASLDIFIDETTPHIPLNVERDTQPTLNFNKVLKEAIEEVKRAGGEEVNGIHVLLAIFNERESQAVYSLNQENVMRVDLINYYTQGITKQKIDQEDFDFSLEQEQSPELGLAQDANGEENLVELYATNLNERARLGKIDPLVGRQEEILRCIQILCRRRKNNPLLVGEAGVGKTAIAEGLAQMIVAGEVPKLLQHSTIYSLDLGVLLAGTKYRGDFEKRFKSVLKVLSKNSGAIIFIDEIHNLVGAGSATGGTMDAANLIKPLLTSGDLRCMGATTYEEYRNFFSKDHALLRRFQKIDVEEPSNSEAVKILEGLQSHFESFHHIKYEPAALERAVELSSRYMADRHLPDKAIDVIDEAGAFQALQTPQKRCKIIGAKEIEEVIAKMAHIPVQSLSISDRQLLKNLPKKLRKVVYGQETAIDSLSDAIKLSRSGLRDPNKPVGSFLMMGPTGVGKTELTKQLAKELGIELLRFDMSEYMEKHAVSRLIGAPPGYVGYDQGGLLTEQVTKHPHAVVLLDEIEKAHPDMFNILLQVMDYGLLTDNNGRKVDFRHIILVMTSNVGADVMERHSIGFADQDTSEDSLQAVKHLFSPEFRNRLDAVIQFKHLESTVMIKVVEKELTAIQHQLEDKHIELITSPLVKAWLAEKGYDRKMGARPLERLIQEKIRKPLADQILFGHLVEGVTAKIHVDLHGDKLQLRVEEQEVTN